MDYACFGFESLTNREDGERGNHAIQHIGFSILNPTLNAACLLLKNREKFADAGVLARRTSDGLEGLEEFLLGVVTKNIVPVGTLET